MEQENQATRAEAAANQPRIAIEDVGPQLDGGRFAAKAICNRSVHVHARIFSDGHDCLAGEVAWREGGCADWRKVPLTPEGNDHWKAVITPTRIGRCEFIVLAWIDGYASFRHDLEKKYAAGQAIDLELREGSELLEQVLSNAPDDCGAELADLLLSLRECDDRGERLGILMAPRTLTLMQRAEHRLHLARSQTFALDVERQLAEFASWYELFPRSESLQPGQHGTFADVHRRLAEIAAMGFDVLYFPPIHPIGHTHRKGRNNSLQASADDPGSPYAIGSEAGGHDAVHPQLGSLEDFRALVGAAREHGLEIALDFAIQCSPDHPWLREHPGWFSWRADGSIRHAENPPKKYEDIVNVDFYAPDAVPELWLALLKVVLGWVEQGVTLFRVDNPHTKPLPFWEWLIAEVRSAHPQVIFLAEAFTRPAMMARLGKLGFSQSYTYFTWRDTKQELLDYFDELNRPPLRDCYRPNFFVNTPDINPYFLQRSGRPGFLIRAALATMGSGLWGMYSGFELCEAAAVPGKEEYLDSEKYQLRQRDYHSPVNIVGEISRLNRIRRENPALHSHLGFHAYNAWNDNILLFGKRTEDLSNFILVAVCLDPHNAQEADFELPLWEFGLPDDAVMGGEDLMNGKRWEWHGKRQWMRIEPWHLPFGIWRLHPHPS
ncbi:alpha-1,4-glucan--maltose-1-phosphate maltosyltransferase [Pseudomonas sp. ZM23]|uniref:Alpha-1,4-glucan:maltose-1-phosphate maltosyltransferase n=1 Tax=Pseudomonas triclosanedens TaxID=2961893 RepID=A0ABY7A857_9PSED|nr:alpha-1,4-glucan--maltose-1-phosphate maltosyltransferase [Pseudomonas triclosanedens]MCP8466252.1 alpha-1,4-glucan--maltose-1-phosphate maltosyltransferase [Pseudomonas triclosanedens]MCP8471778.1 alpha-1,4-glucan--maltose-1-phosphate maltosyltransferase [Pseudomonas triclosanedens]MCP8478869.1 alpha-1,4-glucan--maltose-1-phosphate maltosyltransferase [Pseudomonas triclosanedens]WAI52330.1 alpha-1,4-glucan--maltose-1-phosphate maltosyltransferase [Pseudomonas triclosanedens]